MAVSLGCGGLAFGMAGLLYYSKKKKQKVINTMRFTPTDSIPEAAMQLHLTPGDNPSKFIEIYGTTNCNDPVSYIGGGNRRQAVAHLQQKYRKWREVSYNQERKKWETRHYTTKVHEDLQQTGDLLVDDIKSQKWADRIRELEEHINQKRAEMEYFSSMLSRSKRQKELDAWMDELELLRDCHTSMRVDPSSFNIRDLMLPSGSKFEPASQVNINVNVNSTVAPGETPSKRASTEGYENKESVVPVGRRVYCLGRLTLDKETNSLTLDREPKKPFVLQYGTEEEIIAKKEVNGETQWYVPLIPIIRERSTGQAWACMDFRR